MQTEQKDILNTQLSVENNPKSESGSKTEKEQLFKVKKLIGTPFHILHKEHNYYLTLGNNLLTVGMENETQITTYMEEHKWDITTSLILLLIEQMKKIDNPTPMKPML